MVKYPGESVYTSYVEYLTDLSLTIYSAKCSVYYLDSLVDGYTDCVGTIDRDNLCHA